MTLKTVMMLLWELLKIQLWSHNKLHFNRCSHRKQLFEIVIIFHNFYCIFDQINASLVSRRDFFQRILPSPNFWLLVTFISEIKCAVTLLSDQTFITCWTIKYSHFHQNMSNILQSNGCKVSLSGVKESFFGRTLDLLITFIGLWRSEM